MATIPTMDTWIAGNKVTAAKMNEQLRDAANFLISPPRCMLYNPNQITVGSGSYVALTLTNSAFDNDSMWSAGANTRATVKTAGSWFVEATFNWNVGSASARHLGISRFNSSGVRQEQRWVQTVGQNVSYNGMAIQATMNASVNDYFQVIVLQNTGANLTSVPAAIEGGNPLTFSARWVGKV